MTKFLNRIRNDKRGVTAMEYGLIAALVAVVIITGVSTIGTRLGTTFTSIGNQLPTTATAPANPANPG